MGEIDSELEIGKTVFGSRPVPAVSVTPGLVSYAVCLITRKREGILFPDLSQRKDECDMSNV